MLEGKSAQRLKDSCLVRAGDRWWRRRDRPCVPRVSRARARLILPVPTFEMIRDPRCSRAAWFVRWIGRAGCFRSRRWPRPLASASMIAVVSPNNPTGAVAARSDLVRLAEIASRAALLVDLAYTEFAEEDLTAAALALPNAVVIRTFSKAMGLAGLRVGYAAGLEPVIRAMRAAGSPYPVSAVSLDVAQRAINGADRRILQTVRKVRQERDELRGGAEELGARCGESQGNFVLAEFADAEWVWRALGGLGVAVRRFVNRPGLESARPNHVPGERERLWAADQRSPCCAAAGGACCSTWTACWRMCRGVVPAGDRGDRGEF